MGKKPVDKSLQGKKPINGATASSSGVKPKYGLRANPSHIGNKLKRSEMYGKYLHQKSVLKKELRLQRVQDAEALGQAVVKHTPHTIDNQREIEVTMVDARDPEVLADEADDEFATYFNIANSKSTNPPKVLVTTRPRPSQQLFYFVADLQKLIPGLHFYPRKGFSVKQICQFATNRQFTHLIVLSEKSKVCNGMTISHLGAVASRSKKSSQKVEEELSKNNDEDDSDEDDQGEAEENAADSSHGKDDDSALQHSEGNDDDNDDDEHLLIVGPTAFFKVSHVVTSQNIPNHGASTSHTPELNLHGFATRLGHRVGRLLASLFPIQSPDFMGRQVVTFHNQRDYIFVRHHRYKFQEKQSQQDASSGSKSSSKSTSKSGPPPPLDTTTAPTALSGAAADMAIRTRLQELGPRFTLKLRWLQQGTFDTVAGEYEFLHKRKEMDTSRRKFHL